VWEDPQDKAGVVREARWRDRLEEEVGIRRRLLNTQIRISFGTVFHYTHR